MLQIGDRVRAKTGGYKGCIGNVIGSIPLLSSNPLKMRAMQRELASQGKQIIWTVKFENGDIDSFEESGLDPVSGSCHQIP